MSEIRPPAWSGTSGDEVGSDHDRAIAILEVAAAEPQGLDRLEAGDTEEAAWLAGHLVGCPTCAAEYPRIRALASTVREVVRETPSPDLRDRTLTLVRSAGRPRTAATDGPPATGAVPALPAIAATAGTRGVRSASGRSVPIAWLASVAAAVAISVAITSVLLGGQVNDALSRERVANAALASVTRQTVSLLAQPDARMVGLTSGSSSATGSLLYSPTKGELSVVATGLAEPAAGAEYGCWLEIGGTRHGVGRMWFAGGIGYWVGPADGLAAIGPGSRFGVTLIAPDGTPAGDVLTGDL